jgi:hypothetical protein
MACSSCLQAPGEHCKTYQDTFLTTSRKAFKPTRSVKSTQALQTLLQAVKSTRSMQCHDDDGQVIHCTTQTAAVAAAFVTCITQSAGGSGCCPCCRCSCHCCCGWGATTTNARNPCDLAHSCQNGQTRSVRAIGRRRRCRCCLCCRSMAGCCCSACGAMTSGGRTPYA